MILNTKIRVLLTFWWFRAATHNSGANSVEITTDSQYNQHMRFSTLNVDLNGPSLDPVGSKWLSHEGIKDGYPLKSRCFTSISCTRPVTPFDEYKWNAIYTSLDNHHVECQLLGSLSLYFVCTQPSNMHCCHTFLFALAWFSCYRLIFVG